MSDLVSAVLGLGARAFIGLAEWILTTGTWDDGLRWIDAANWKDS